MITSVLILKKNYKKIVKIHFCFTEKKDHKTYKMLPVLQKKKDKKTYKMFPVLQKKKDKKNIQNSSCFTKEK